MTTYTEQSQEYKAAMQYMRAVSPETIDLIKRVVRNLPEYETAHMVTHQIAAMPAYEWALPAPASDTLEKPRPTAKNFWNAVAEIAEYELLCRFPPTTGVSALGGLIAAFDQHICG